MTTFLKTTVIATSLLLASGVASASTMYIDTAPLGNYDYTFGTHTADAGTTTGIFFEFGFNGTKATSLYDMTDGSVFGSFYDTNIASELTAAGVPASGTALDGNILHQISLVMPNYAGGAADLDALNSIVPPLSGDSEGFLGTWDLQVKYHFDGTLTATGPVYTGGTFEVFFNDLATATLYDTLVLSGNLTGSALNVANLELFFDVTYALDNFLFVKDSHGNYVDAYDMIGVPGAPVTLTLNTNVNPPIPTADQLLLVGTNAIRQADLHGGVTANIPEPGTLALAGLGLLGMGALRRRREVKE